MKEKLTGSLRYRMTVLFGLVVLIGCLVLTFVSVNRAGSALKSEAEQAMLKLIKQAAETQDSRIQARIYTIESIASRNVIRGISGERESTVEEKLKTLVDEQKRVKNLNFKQFGIADLKGNALFFDGRTANVADRDYFKAAVGGKTAVSSTILSRIDNTIVVAYATPIRHYATDEITGVLIGLVDANKFSEMLSGITYGRTGFAYAVDGTGKTIAHREIERVISQENVIEKARSDKSLAPVAEAVSKMLKEKEGIATYSFQGQKKIIAYAPIKSTGWTLVVTAPESEVLEKTASLKHAMLIISAVIILAALLLTYLMAGAISKPLIRAVDFLDHIAGGDFTRPVSDRFLRMKDEIGKLARAVDGLQANIKPMLSSIKEGAKVLSGNSENLSAASEEIASSSSEVAKAIEQVAAGASEQAEHLQEILKLTEDIADHLENVKNELGNVKEGSEEASRLAGVGKKELDVLIASINGVHEAFRVVGEKLTALSNSVNQVGEILEAINNIADQTNLLALNAAIEAARAGEAGRGFAVVAEEVRKLAEESRASSDKIKELLGAITAETDEVVNTSEKVSKQVAEQLESVNNTVKSFDDILDSVMAIMPKIEETYRRLDSTIKAKDTILDRVQSISAVSEEASASAQQISASAEELSASTEEIAANAQEVLKVAKNLEEQVERFKV
jgi:methyl-accepting chemotaxis protein